MRANCSIAHPKLGLWMEEFKVSVLIPESRATFLFGLVIVLTDKAYGEQQPPMVETRRKSQAIKSADDDEDNGLQIPDDVDLETLAQILPDVKLTGPSPEDIVALYKLLIAQASDIDATQRELDEAHANAEKKDVELDQALQDRERTSKDLETRLESIQEELNHVKGERDELSVYSELSYDSFS